MSTQNQFYTQTLKLQPTLVSQIFQLVLMRFLSLWPNIENSNKSKAFSKLKEPQFMSIQNQFSIQTHKLPPTLVSPTSQLDLMRFLSSWLNTDNSKRSKVYSKLKEHQFMSTQNLCYTQTLKQLPISVSPTFQSVLMKSHSSWHNTDNSKKSKPFSKLNRKESQSTWTLSQFFIQTHKPPPTSASSTCQLALMSWTSYKPKMKQNWCQSQQETNQEI